MVFKCEWVKDTALSFEKKANDDIWGEIWADEDEGVEEVPLVEDLELEGQEVEEVLKDP